MKKYLTPCLTRKECAQALKMEHLGFSAEAIAKEFGVSRNSLIITMHNAKEFGFVYFAYQGILLDHMQTLRALGAKRYSYGVYSLFIQHVGATIISRYGFSRALGAIRPFL